MQAFYFYFYLHTIVTFWMNTSEYFKSLLTNQEENVKFN